MRNLTKHIPHYISLLGILFAALLAFYAFPNEKSFLAGVTIAVAASYVSWGIIHHMIHKNLYFAIVAEYFAVAVLGMIIVLSLIFRS